MSENNKGGRPDGALNINGRPDEVLNINGWLDEALIEYGASDIYPFHMPGHKRHKLGDPAPEEIDITEVEDFDDLHHAEGILRVGQERLARLAGADESFYLVNGSTAGILAAVCGCVKKGGRLLIARNCHKSVYHAAYLTEARLEYLYPEPAGPGAVDEARPGGAAGEKVPAERPGAAAGEKVPAERPGAAAGEKVPADRESFVVPGSISPAQVEEALRRIPDIQAVVITSPTYDGVVSDIGAIADIVHAHDIPLIVDEAHGAHFGFADCFPQKAVALGADLCVESLHKTLPAYTQSAALHMKQTVPCPAAAGSAGDGSTAADLAGTDSAGMAPAAGYRFDAGRVRRYLDIFQSSSPSYVLMAGIDRCVRMIGEDRKLYCDPATRPESLFGQFEERLRSFYERCGELRTVRLFPPGPAAPGADTQPGAAAPGADTQPVAAAAGADTQYEAAAPGIYARDPSKILICAEEAGLHGQQLYDLLLDKYHLQMEMAAGSYVTALTTIMDTDEGFARLFEALAEIDRAAGGAQEASGKAGPSTVSRTDKAPEGTPNDVPRNAPDDSVLYGPKEKCLEIAQAMDAESAPFPLSEAAGKTAAEFICLYPPGIPILVPGEVVTGEIVRQLERCASCSMRIRGLQGANGLAISVVV